jgi:hypothetical protein
MKLKLTTFTLLFFILITQTLMFGQNMVRNLPIVQRRTKNLPLLKDTIKNIYHFKIYYSFIKFSTDRKMQEGTNIIQYQEDNNKFGHVSTSFAIEKAKSIHEIELSRIEFYRTDNATYVYNSIDDTAQITAGQLAKIINIGIKYEYNRKIVEVKNNLQFLIAASTEPYLESIIIKPKIVTGFTTKGLHLGSKFYFIPRAIYKFKSKFYIDINFPVELFDCYWVRSLIKNPTLPMNLQKSNKFNIDFFNKVFQFRIGFGIRI